MPTQAQPLHKCFKPWAPIPYLNISSHLAFSQNSYLTPSFLNQKRKEEKRSKTAKIQFVCCLLYAQLKRLSVLLQCPYYSALKCQLACLPPLLYCWWPEVSYGIWIAVELPVLGKGLGKYLRSESMNKFWFFWCFIFLCVFQIFKYEHAYFEYKTNRSKNINESEIKIICHLRW